MGQRRRRRTEAEDPVHRHSSLVNLCRKDRRLSGRKRLFHCGKERFTARFIIYVMVYTLDIVTDTHVFVLFYVHIFFLRL